MKNIILELIRIDRISSPYAVDENSATKGHCYRQLRMCKGGGLGQTVAKRDAL